jgi:pyruvate ferredoxin oxidoreductase gamma subunit
MLIVGRGGEGVVLASQILADTFARAGFYVQSFPEFKAERRGAPIAAFLRWDAEAPIRRRYKVKECDVLLDVSLAEPSEEQLRKVRPGGLVLLNRESRFRHTGSFDIARTPASRIARDNGVLSSEGRPMGNIAMLGAALKVLLPDGLHFLEEAIEARMGARIAATNLHAAREGYAQCRKQHQVRGDELVESRFVTLDSTRFVPLFALSQTTSLGNKTGTWSLDRPVVLEKCNSCGICALFCPEGAIARHDGVMVFDLDHCKGCGICEDVCPVRNAIEMEEVTA